jgi:hypothetical protein
MYTDALLQLSSAQAVTSTAFSTNTIDLLQARNIGAGGGDNDALNVLITVDTTVTAAGAATVNFQVVTSANANLSSPTIIGQTDAIPKAALTAGKQIVVPIPRSFINVPGQRYLGVQYTVTTGPLTAGAFTASVVLQGADSVGNFYASGFAVK